MVSYRDSCKGKHRHKSRGAADAQLRSIKKLDPKKAELMHSYPCFFCKKWHVGHKIGINTNEEKRKNGSA